MEHGQCPLEGMVSELNFATRWSGRSVFLSGHTGFKGGWLALWLARLGAHVHGYALAPKTTPSLFELAQIESSLASHHVADIRDPAALSVAMCAAQPEVVFHLAAQPLVRFSYREPVTTWATNVMGTVNLLEAVRACPSVKAVVVVTTDKCYENREWFWGYRESDPLGGSDPYSASKAGAELVLHSYRSSFFSKGGPEVATARAGNVLGGGDWSDDRLIPDVVRAVVAGRTLDVRNPDATRPWQHVLDSLYGYLSLADHLLDRDAKVAGAFNFGPAAEDNCSVLTLLTSMKKVWPKVTWQVQRQAADLHEANFLYLDSSKAQRLLNWHPRWRLDRALAETARWYLEVLEDPTQARRLCDQQIDFFSATK